jgi:chemotaxis methyl-accepting protein methylase
VPATVAEGKAKLPGEIKGRIEFMEHDFFKEQPVKGADVYLLRWIMHDWSDEYCIKILSQLVPAMTEQSRLLISESVMPPIGTLSSQQEKNFS